MKTFSKKPAALTAAVLAALIVMELAPQAGAAVGMDVEDWYFQGRAAGGCGFTRRAGSSTPCRRITTSKSIAACGVRPLLLQTLVDRPYSGTCYRAANWILVGQTQGRGRMDRTQIVSGDMSRRISDFFGFPRASRS